jgi:sugar phosphate permease
MNRQFVISGVVISILAFVFGGVIHGVLLAGDYAQLPNLMRTQEDSMNYFHWNIVAHVFMGFAMTWMYRQGVDAAQPWLMQGVRFGIAVLCLFVIPMFLIYYAVSPFPGALVVKQIGFETVGTVILGITTAYLNRPPAAV